VLKAHVEDGKVVKITTVKDPDLRACVRGLHNHRRVYHPERLKCPLRRVGEKGEGKFERISWDEALDAVAERMEQVKSAYGNSAFLLCGSGGNSGVLHNTNTIYGSSFPLLLFNRFGGFTGCWNIVSCQGALFDSQYTFGSLGNSNEAADLLNSRLIILWGFNPLDTIQGTGTYRQVAKAKEAGCKMISVDPMLSNTAKRLKIDWIPILPGTDTAMLAAMAYVMISLGLEDRAFLDKFTVGFDIFRNYILGTEDRQPKTPKWAESITGVPASSIEDLARLYAGTKPAALIQGWGPGRTAFGEQFHRMATTLGAMTANVGIKGGSSGINLGDHMPAIGSLPVSDNPVDTYIKHDNLADCILKGKAGGYPADIKMMYLLGSNPLNQNQNINKSVKAYKELEFLVAHEHFLTPTAKFADIVLPVTTHFERNDIYYPWGSGRYLIYNNKVIEPMYECRSDMDILTELAERLGISDFNPKTEDQWLREFVAKSDIPNYDEFKKKGFHKFEFGEPRIFFKDQIEDPEKHPFPTPSGKIEIYSEELATMDFENSIFGSSIPPIPVYIPDPDSGDSRDTSYPLRLVTPHFKYRTHTNFNNVDELTRRYTHEVWINSQDAKERNIKHGDEVAVYNDLGRIITKAKPTDRIMPGVVAVYQGMGYHPDKRGVDKGGAANVLTRDAPSPAGAAPYNSSWVQISG